MTATLERDLVSEARAQLEAAIAERDALTARLATDSKLTPRHLREAEEAVTFARQKLAAAERHTGEQARAAIRRAALALYERAATVRAEAARLEPLQQRFGMLRDELDRAICNVNIGAHGLSEDGQALEGQARAIGEDLGIIFAELGIAGFEWFAQRLQGGTRVGDCTLPKYQIPIVSGGYDPALAKSAPPAPPPPPPGPSCVVTDEGGRRWSWKDHLVTPVDAGDMNVARRGGYRCERCGTWWSRAAWEAHWRPANAAGD